METIFCLHSHTPPPVITLTTQPHHMEWFPKAVPEQTLLQEPQHHHPAPQGGPAFRIQPHAKRIISEGEKKASCPAIIFCANPPQPTGQHTALLDQKQEHWVGFTQQMRAISTLASAGQMLARGECPSELLHTLAESGLGRDISSLAFHHQPFIGWLKYLAWNLFGASV